MHGRQTADPRFRWRRRATFLLAAAGCALLAACGQADPAALTATSAPALPPTAALQGAQPTAADTATQATGDVGAGGWSVDVLQGGQITSAEAGQVRLARAPFTLRVSLPEAVPIKLNANADDANFIALQPGYVFTEDCLDALCTGMDVAEERLNPTQVLFVDPQSTHYLYYQGPDDHRWSRAVVNENGAVFERDVAQLNDVPIEQFEAPELYLLLFADRANPGVIDPGELKKIVLLLQ